MTLVTIRAPESGVFRLARAGADPFAPPAWTYRDEDGTFGNRFDDPTVGEEPDPGDNYRAVYCATQRAAAFGETLARFRPSLELLRGLAQIADDESMEEALTGAMDPADPGRLRIQPDWRLRRRVGHTILDPTLAFVDITDGSTMQHLRAALAPTIVRLGIADFDLSSVIGPHRHLTQCCARYIYEQRDDDGNPRYAGVRYLCRHNPDWECWAIFDGRLQHRNGFPGPTSNIMADDIDLISVAELFSLSIEVISGQSHHLRP